MSVRKSEIKRVQRPDRRRDRTREALLRAGRALFSTRDVEGVSVDEIVAAADVAKGSFYNHFPDKEAFAREISSQVRQQVELAIEQATKDVADPAAHIARALCVVVRFAIEHSDSAQVLWRLFPRATLPDAPINRGVRTIVKRGIACDRFRHIDLSSGILLIIGIIIITVRHVLEEQSSNSPPEITELMAAGLLRSLGIPPAQAGSIARRAVEEILLTPSPGAA
jgi:AcrR family transcriptional regulator